MKGEFALTSLGILIVFKMCLLLIFLLIFKIVTNLSNN